MIHVCSLLPFHVPKKDRLDPGLQGEFLYDNLKCVSFCYESAIKKMEKMRHYVVDKLGRHLILKKKITQKCIHQSLIPNDCQLWIYNIHQENFELRLFFKW